MRKLYDDRSVMICFNISALREFGALVDCHLYKKVVGISAVTNSHSRIEHLNQRLKARRD
jgi:hypothetical protein